MLTEKLREEASEYLESAANELANNHKYVDSDYVVSCLQEAIKILETNQDKESEEK